MEIIEASAVDDSLLLDAINSSFEWTPKTLEWFRWKHRSGPWGPSIGHAAVLNGEVVGVRLFTPWSIRGADGDISILRAMDGAVVPTARRQGLFSRLIMAQIEALRGSASQIAAIYSTSVSASRAAYEKLGWSVFDVPHRLFVPPFNRAEVTHHHWPNIPDFTPAPSWSRVSTSWSAEALEWRTNPQSGHEYSSYSLVNADAPNGLILRKLLIRGVPVGVIVESWGSSKELRSLEGAAARASRCVALWTARAEEADFGRISRSRGSSAVSLVVMAEERQQQMLEPQNWAFTFADLEGVM